MTSCGFKNDTPKIESDPIFSCLYPALGSCFAPTPIWVILKFVDCFGEITS